MSTNYTEKLGLTLWEADDPVLRTEFNANHNKLDTAIAALSAAHGCVSGTYEGGASPDRVTINVGFQPSFAVIMCDHPNSSHGSDTMCLLAIPGAYARLALSSTKTALSNILTETGLDMAERSNNQYGLNVPGMTYHYALYH